MISKDFFENIEFESTEEECHEIENVFQEVYFKTSKDGTDVIERLKKEKVEVEKMLSQQ